MCQIRLKILVAWTILISDSGARPVLLLMVGSDFPLCLDSDTFLPSILWFHHLLGPWNTLTPGNRKKTGNTHLLLNYLILEMTPSLLLIFHWRKWVLCFHMDLGRKGSPTWKHSCLFGHPSLWQLKIFANALLLIHKTNSLPLQGLSTQSWIQSLHATQHPESLGVYKPR